ncbi:MAG: MucR family transcriptional regulator [Minwuia sp.]|nr:MucR family transcriptional regulator [Minwuia sp.]
MSSEDEDGSLARIMNMTVQIVTAYVAKNEIGVDGLVSLIGDTQSALSGIDSGEVSPDQRGQEPAVPIEQSIKDQYLICLEDGRKLKTLRRHLHAAYGMTPEQYRAKWLLPPDYPMVAPAYSRQRSEFARKSGLGKKPID